MDEGDVAVPIIVTLITVMQTYQLYQMWKQYTKLHFIKKLERTSILDKNRLSQTEDNSVTVSENQENEILEVNIAISQMRRIKLLILMYLAICLLTLVFQLFSSFLPLLYFMLAFLCLGQILQLKLITQSQLAAHSTQRKKIRFFWFKLQMVAWGLIVFFGILPFSGWGPVCNPHIQFPICFLIQVVFQSLIAFFIVTAVKAEADMHIPTRASSIINELYKSQAYQDFKQEIKNEKTAGKFQTKSNKQQDKPKDEDKDDKVESDKEKKIQNLLYDLSEESIKINKSMDLTSSSIEESKTEDYSVDNEVQSMRGVEDDSNPYNQLTSGQLQLFEKIVIQQRHRMISLTIILCIIQLIITIIQLISWSVAMETYCSPSGLFWVWDRDVDMGMNIFILFHMITVIAPFQIFYNIFYTIPTQLNYFDEMKSIQLRTPLEEKLRAPVEDKVELRMPKSEKKQEDKAEEYLLGGNKEEQVQVVVNKVN